MYSTICTALLSGIRAQEVRVEVDISSGMPSFDMLGNLSQEVREARDRVRTALHSCGIVLPAKKITVNLSPANLRKYGTGFDLPIAIALLCGCGLVETDLCKNVLFVGELGLNGQILPVNGILPIVSDGMTGAIERPSTEGEGAYDAFVVPAANLTEARLVTDADVYGFSTLMDLIDFLNGKAYREPRQERICMEAEVTMDFSEVYGQPLLKRCCEIAAAGMHNLLIVGPPGAGKTMVSQRMSTILPPMTHEEQLELSKIYSVCGLLSEKHALLSERPFRSPHHTITQPALAGGGRIPQPGEVSLAHHGVLFLDELPEFSKSVLEVLRQPMEDRKIVISRVTDSITYPSDFLLLASMNPCKCGYYPDMQRCRCTPGQIRSYLSRISQPLLDRMDLCVNAPALKYGEITAAGTGETSAQIRARVTRCHKLQYERYKDEPFLHNSRISAEKIRKYCVLDEREQHYMENMFDKLELTARSYHKILRVARTIADLEECEQIQLRHLNEAVCYRTLDEHFWGGIIG